MDTKMRSLSCMDMGNKTCQFVAKGMTDEEVMKKMTEHIKSAHPDTMKTMDEEQMMDKMKDKIKDV